MEPIVMSEERGVRDGEVRFLKGVLRYARVRRRCWPFVSSITWEPVPVGTPLSSEEGFPMREAFEEEWQIREWFKGEHIDKIALGGSSRATEVWLVDFMGLLSSKGLQRALGVVGFEGATGWNMGVTLHFRRGVT